MSQRGRSKFMDGWGILFIVLHLGLVGLAIYLLIWTLKLAEASGSDSKFVAACLAFAGVVSTTLVTATATTAATLLKRPLEERNMLLKEATEAREQYAEKRQDVDTVVRIVALLGTDDGKDAGRSQQIAALFALALHDKLPMALCLLENMWRDRMFSSYAACWLLDRAFQKDDEDSQIQAAEVLLEHTDLLLTEDMTCQWVPSIDWDWPENLTDKAKPKIVEALFSVLMRRKGPEDWDPSVIVGFCILAYEIMRKEGQETTNQQWVRKAAAGLLRSLLEILKRKSSVVSLPSGDREITELTKLAEDVRDGLATTLSPDGLINKLEKWTKN